MPTDVMQPQKMADFSAQQLNKIKGQFANNSKRKQQIGLDEYGEYTLEQDYFRVGGTTELYDDNKLIAEVMINKGSLILILKTNKQVNIFADIVKTNFTVLAEAPICIDGKLTCDVMQLNAKAISICDDFKAKSINCIAEGEVKFLAAVKSGNIDITARTLTIADGAKFECKNANVNTNSISLLENSQLIVTDSEITCTDKLTCDKSSKLSIKQHSKLNANRMILDGVTEIVSSEVSGKMLFSIDSNASFVANNSKVKLENTAVFKGKNRFENRSLLNAHSADLHGAVNVNECVLNVDNLSFDTTQGNVDRSVVTSEILQLATVDNAHELGIRQSIIVSDALRQKGKVKLQASKLAVTNDSALVHEVAGELIITDRSEYALGDSILRNKQGGKVIVRNSSKVSASAISNAGKIKINESQVETQTLSNTNAKFKGTAAAVKVKGNIHSSNSKTKLNKSSVSSTNYTDDGKLKLADSRVAISQNLATKRGSKQRVSSSHLKAKQTFAAGDMKLTKSAVETDSLNVFDSLSAEQGSLLKVDGEAVLSKSSTTKLDASALKTDKLTTLGKHQAKKSQTDVTSHIITSDQSQTEYAGSKLTAKDFNHLGSFSSKTITEADKGGKTKTAVTQLNVTNNLTTHKHSKITGDDLSIESDQFLQHGGVSIQGRLQAKGTDLQNFGCIQAGFIDLGYDTSVVNSGLMIGNTVSINTLAMVNALGVISAEDSLVSNSLLKANLGIIAAGSANTNSLFSLNSGLVLPNFGSLKPNIGLNHLLTAGKMAATHFLPDAGNLISGIGMIPSILTTGAGLIDTFSKADFTNMRRHELMAPMCQVKSAVSLGYNTCKAAAAISNELSEEKTSSSTVGTETAENVEVDENSCNSPDLFNQLSTGLSAINLGELAWTAGTQLGGTYSDDSLINFNSGVILSHNSSQTSALSMNTGINASLQTQYCNNLFSVNTGQHLAGDLTHSTLFNAYNAGALAGLHRFNLTGGSYSNLHGGTIYGANAAISLEQLKLAGSVELDRCVSSITNTIVTDSGSYKVKDTLLKGETLESKGHTDFENAAVEVGKVILHDGATEKYKNVSIRSEQMIDASKLHYDGSVVIDVDEYKHSGNIVRESNVASGDEPNDVLLVMAESGELNGSADIGTGIFSINNLSDAEQFAAGQGNYAAYQFQDMLSLTTTGHVTLDGQIERNCNLSMRSTSIDYNAVWNTDKFLGLTSTEGDINFYNDVKAGHIYVDSAGNITNNSNIEADGLVQCVAKGNFTNLGGTVNGDIVNVLAASIFNITAGSAAAANYSGEEIGSGGIINGRTDTYLTATEGNIENHGGVIRGGTYCQLMAAGDVLNVCNERSYQGKHDVVKEYDAGLITGGSGHDEDGIGLYIKADGKVVLDASDLISDGSMYVDGDKGIEGTVRSHTYVSKDKKKSKFCGFKKKHIIETSTNIGSSTMASRNGRVIGKSENGEINCQATNFIAAEGTDLYANKDVNLFSLKTNDRRYEKRTSFWGLSQSKRSHMLQSAAPTLFADNGLVRIHSETGDVNAVGTVFMGDGDLYIKAAHKIVLGREVLHNTIVERTRSIGFSCFGSSAFSTLSNGGNLWEAISSEDSTLSKINSLCGSNNGTEAAFNAANLGISTLNSGNSIMRGLANDNVGQELMASHGLGQDGFDPSLTFSFTNTSTKANYDTLGAGGVSRNNIHLEAEDSVEFINGVEVHARGNMTLRTPKCILRAAELDCSTSHKSQTYKVTVTASGELKEVGAGYSFNKSKSTTNVNSVIRCDGELDLGDMENLTLDGGHIDTNTIRGNVDQLDVITRQDTSSYSNQSYSASTSGNVSAYVGSGSSQVVNNVSGIHVAQGINHQDDTFIVDTYNSTGGEITTDGQNNFIANTINATEVVDSIHDRGMGISMNLNDLDRLSPEHEATNNVGEPAIATTTIVIDQRDFKAVQQSTIYGEDGTDIQAETINGNINSDNPSGYQVERDSAMHLTVDAPITNAKHIDAARDNYQAGMAVLKDKFSASAAATDIDSQENSEPEQNSSEYVDEDLLNAAEINGDIWFDAVEQENEQDINTPEPLSEHELQEINDKLKNINLEDPEIKLALTSMLARAKQEISENGSVSSETEKQLKNVILNSALEVLRDGSDLAWGRIIEAVGKNSVGVYVYMNAKGAMLNFAFNFALSKETACKERTADGIAVTAADYTIAYGLEQLIGNAAGPVGWILLGVVILDDFIDQEVMQQRMLETERLRQESRSMGFFAGHGCRELARDMQEATANQQMIQHAANGIRTFEGIFEGIFEGMVDCCFYVLGLNSDSAATPVEQPQTEALQTHGMFGNSNDSNTNDSNSNESTVVDTDVPDLATSSHAQQSR